MSGKRAKPGDTASKSAMSSGKAAYEARRAAEAGLSLEGWLKKKARDAAASTGPQAAPKTPVRKGLLSRLLDKAHRPI